LYRRLAAIDSTKRRAFALSLLDQAHIEENLSQTAASLEHSREGVQILDALLAASPHDAKLSAECAMAHVRLSDALRLAGKLEDALAQPPAERAAFLAETSREDADLAREVSSLLDSTDHDFSNTDWRRCL
jgi:hypothetical protein